MAARATAGWAAQQRRAFRAGLLPALIALAAVTLGPAIYLVVTSLTPLTPVNPDTAFDFSDPLGNYQAIAATDEFWHSVWVQVELSLVTVVTQLLAGLGWRCCSTGRRAFSKHCAPVFCCPWCCRRSLSR